MNFVLADSMDLILPLPPLTSLLYSSCLDPFFECFHPTHCPFESLSSSMHLDPSLLLLFAPPRLQNHHRHQIQMHRHHRQHHSYRRHHWPMHHCSETIQIRRHHSQPHPLASTKYHSINPPAVVPSEIEIDPL